MFKETLSPGGEDAEVEQLQAFAKRTSAPSCHGGGKLIVVLTPVGNLGDRRPAP